MIQAESPGRSTLSGYVALQDVRYLYLLGLRFANMQGRVMQVGLGFHGPLMTAAAPAGLPSDRACGTAAFEMPSQGSVPLTAADCLLP